MTGGNFTAPAGSVLDATTVGDRLYTIIRTDDAVGLWTADLAATDRAEGAERHGVSGDAKPQR